MITQHTLDKIFAEGLLYGADFVEVFAEETQSEKIHFLNKKLKETVGGIDFGVGIRLIQGYESYYAYTNNTSLDSLLFTLKNAAACMQQKNHSHKQQIISAPNNFVKFPIQKSFQEIPIQEKINLLKIADEAARAQNQSISQVSSTYFEQTQHVQIANSEGLNKSDTRHRGRFSIVAIASNGSESQSGSESPGSRKGWEFFAELNVKDLARKAASRAALMLNSSYISSGTMPVIIDKGFGGVIFHEACGHPLESHAVNRQASVFANKINEAIASDLVNAVDDGTLDSEWGSLSIDDEGTPTQRTVLIENGILKNYMNDRIGAMQLNVPLTGSARRESYQFAPVSRMRNTFILPGKTPLEDMIKNTPEGLYAKQLGGGSVNPSTGEFNFAVTEGYLIKNGKILKPVRGAVLIGKGQEILKDIDMVGNELQLAQGMCGASSGWVPVNVGQPALRVKNMIIGGV